MALSSSMPPPQLPAKGRKRPMEEADDDGSDGEAAAPGPAKAAKPAAKRPQLGEELPDEVSQQDIDRMLDEADDVHIENLTETSLKRMVLQLQRKVKVNQDLRIKHSDEPDKFLKSEVDLDEEVKRFTILGAHPELYPCFLKLGALPDLVGLLNHVNTDIAVDVFEVLSELTDPDVIGEVEEPETFFAALFEAGLCEMSVDVLMRIDEDASEEDAKAVTNCLTMMENLADLDPKDTCMHFAKAPKLLPWLIKRVRAQGDVDYNRSYAAEILGIMLQNSEQCREAMLKLDGVDKLLRGIAVYRKRDPVDSEEEEFVQNMFDCLCSLMLMSEHQASIGKVQGLELMIRMMRERKFAGGLALKLTDHALRDCPANCQIFVEKLGLKVLFAMFMKRGPKVKARSEVREGEEHVASVVQSLCRHCTGTAVARVLNKFTENRFEKLERLLEMHEEYARSVADADAARLRGETMKIDRELEVDEEEQLYLDRCDAGLFTLQQLDVTIVRLANMGNRQVSDEITKLLDTKGVPLQEVLATTKEYCEHLDASKASREVEELARFARALAARSDLPDPFPDLASVEAAPAAAETPPATAGAVTPPASDDERGGDGAGEEASAPPRRPSPARRAAAATPSPSPPRAKREREREKEKEKEKGDRHEKKDKKDKRREKDRGKDKDRG
eukprot:TRINITY_DN19914_c0_g6_i1.p1 TRINITY_DN19914_c0_g6~~TRINITY_DN19914_c0_g6_i1.p1  ORF type:complete len:710 (-),score=216.59 TRINITY_DN19914_c0_g6_i1:72-2093(-)